MGQYYSVNANRQGGNMSKTVEKGGISSSPANKSTIGTSQINSYDRCMLQLKLQRDNLKKATQTYEYRAASERELAIQFMKAGKRDKALYCLRKKRAQECHIERTSRYLNNVFEMIETVDNRALTNEVGSALDVGTQELRALQEHLSIDEIQEMRDNAEEQMQLTKYISELLSQNLTDADESRIEAELEELVHDTIIDRREEKKSDYTVDLRTGNGVGAIIVPTHEPLLVSKVIETDCDSHVSEEAGETGQRETVALIGL